MKKFLAGILFGFLYVALLFGAFYKGVADECRYLGYNSAAIGTAGAICFNTPEQDNFRFVKGNF